MIIVLLWLARQLIAHHRSYYHSIDQQDEWRLGERERKTKRTRSTAASIGCGESCLLTARFDKNYTKAFNILYRHCCRRRGVYRFSLLFRAFHFLPNDTRPPLLQHSSPSSPHSPEINEPRATSLLVTNQ